MYDDTADLDLDAHLEAQYEDAYGGFDDDPDPYSGTYSEM